MNKEHSERWKKEHEELKFIRDNKHKKLKIFIRKNILQEVYDMVYVTSCDEYHKFLIPQIKKLMEAK